MVFKKVACEFAQFTEGEEGNLGELAEKLKYDPDNKDQKSVPMCGPFPDKVVEFTEDQDKQQNSTKTKRKRRGHGREEHCVVKDIMRALCLCHNVTPTYDTNKQG
jgi:hypothetical protein